MITEIILGFSILLNGVLLWYIFKLLKKLIFQEDEFYGLKEKMLEFATHLRAINKVDSFYGDPTITSLIKHMGQLAGDIEEYSKVLVVFEDDIQEEEDAR